MNTPLSFMENENEEVLEEESNDEGQKIQDDKTAELEAKLKEKDGIIKRLSTKLDKVKQSASDEEEAPKEEKKPNEFGLAEKSYLIANGIKDSQDIAYIKEVMENTGKSLEQVLETKYVQKELEEMAENRKVEAATPTNSNRATPQKSAKTTVEYWLDKGEMPPAEYGVELQRAYVNKKYENEKVGGSKFTDRPFG